MSTEKKNIDVVHIKEKLKKYPSDVEPDIGVYWQNNKQHYRNIRTLKEFEDKYAWCNRCKSFDDNPMGCQCYTR